MNQNQNLRNGLGQAIAYLLLGWPVRLIVFILVTVLIPLGIGLSVLWVGIPIFAGALLLARVAAQSERSLLRTVFHGEAVIPPYQRRQPDESWLRSVKRLFTDPQSWLDVAWVWLAFFVGVFTWSATVVWLALCSAVVLGPVGAVINAALGSDGGGLAYLFGLPYRHVLDGLINFGLGLGAIVVAPRVFRGLAKLQTGVGEVLLNTRGRDAMVLAQLRDSRSSAHRAEAASLRRLERDIHDGPQQRLVRINMDLARARRQVAQHPERADEILQAAMAQTQETLAELRQLSRGIAPPVLADRGLEAAIQEAADRSSIPATVYASLGEVPVHVEQAAYFVVSEALANANKHSGASTIDIVVAVQDDMLYLTVTDDGRGGASPAKGHGLAGLRQRLDGVDGTLNVCSPEGGPTIIEAVIACGSS